MNLDLLFENLTNPALLFFLLGILAVILKSDLEIPPNSSKFISLYLLFSIGFKGGQELAHTSFDMQIVWCILFAVLMAIIIPIYTFFILRCKFNIYDSGAIAAAYGSVSAVTFVTAISFLEMQNIPYNGYMVAVMALMEAPAIIVGVFLVQFFNPKKNSIHIFGMIKHSFTNGSVLLIIGSLLIGFLASEKQALGIKPFTTDLFKGFLAIFLLDMGISSGRKIKSLISSGWFVFLFAIMVPLFNGVLVAYFSKYICDEIGNRLLISILAASASYIAVPAAVKIAIPKANSGLFLPMALAITFPINITIGLPIFYLIID